jgi:DNA-binding response OmpR family regulator
MKKKILVLDDEMSICLLLENFLSKNYEVVSMNNGLDALLWLDDNIPDLIISDIQMEKMDGYEFLTKLRQRGFTNTPCIMLSGKSESKERIKCYKLGAQDYLTKPFNPEELDELVKKICSHSLCNRVVKNVPTTIITQSKDLMNMNPILNILYIGNNPAYFDVIKQHNKWTIITLENSAKVTNYLETQHKPDAIICDYNLPGNNGFSFRLDQK